MATVSLQRLSKKFAGAAAVEALDLEIGNGEFVALLGPSGCGKTTTLRLIAGFLQPDEGEIRIGDKVISSPSVLLPPERRSMSMIFQSYAVWPHMTVFQNVAYGLKIKKLPRQEIERKVVQVLRLVHLEPLKERYSAELSGGQQQRVALARALVVEPEILLMDEPLSNLDANLREEMRFEIRRLHEEFAITTVYVTHDQAEAMATADRIAVLNKGRLVQAGKPADIFDRPLTRFVAEFVGKANILTGELIGGGALRLTGGQWIQVAGDANAPAQGAAAVCLRPHHIRLTTDEAEAKKLAGAGYNLFSGVIQRLIYFGETADYAVDLAPHPFILRVVSPPAQLYQKGQRVFALAAPDHCVVVRDE